MGDYVLRICCCALICGALGAIGGAGAGVRKVVQGLFLAFMVISPLRQIELDGLFELPQTLYEQGQEISQAAAMDTREEIEAVIKEELVSYILVEADSLGAEIEVASITLDPDTLEPVEVALSGDISPYKRQMLSGYLYEELGIGKEQQIWNGGA